MAKKFYKKASPKRPVYVNGQPILFELINIELGVYETDNVQLQTEFFNMAERGIGGVFEINETEYGELKKKAMGSHVHFRDELGKGFRPATHRPQSDLVPRAADEPVAAVPVKVAEPVVAPVKAPNRPQPRK